MENNTPATEPVNALVVLINKAGLEPETAKTLQERFQQFYITAKEWEAKAKEIVITDASQTDLMSLARSGRLLLKNIRTDVEKTRKTLKEDSLRKGQAIDGIAKTLKGLIEPIEEYLEKQENFVQLQEAKRQAELRATRSQELSQYGVVMPPSYDLGKTPDDMYDTMLAGAKKKHEDAIEAERLEKEEKLRQEQEAVAEKERLRLDNERLRQEAETARVEQERKDAEATAEREKLQAELAEKEEELSRQALTLQVEREEVDRLGQELEEKNKPVEFIPGTDITDVEYEDTPRNYPTVQPLEGGGVAIELGAYTEEVKLVMALGDRIGYGNLMDIASILWELRHNVPTSGVFRPVLPEMINKFYEADIEKERIAKMELIKKFFL